MLPLEAPARVNETILDFIASVAPGPMRGVAGAGVGVRRPALRRLVDRATALFRRG